jgi:hypothetical protein
MTVKRNITGRLKQAEVSHFLRGALFCSFRIWTRGLHDLLRKRGLLPSATLHEVTIQKTSNLALILLTEIAWLIIS